MHMKQTYSPEEAEIVRDAFVLARRTFRRRLTKDENTGLARAVIDIASRGCLDVDKLATRAVVRLLREA